MLRSAWVRTLGGWGPPGRGAAAPQCGIGRPGRPGSLDRGAVRRARVGVAMPVEAQEPQGGTWTTSGDLVAVEPVDALPSLVVVMALSLPGQDWGHRLGGTRVQRPVQRRCQLRVADRWVLGDRIAPLQRLDATRQPGGKVEGPSFVAVGMSGPGGSGTSSTRDSERVRTAAETGVTGGITTRSAGVLGSTKFACDGSTARNCITLPVARGPAGRKPPPPKGESGPH